MQTFYKNRFCDMVWPLIYGAPSAHNFSLFLSLSRSHFNGLTHANNVLFNNTDQSLRPFWKFDQGKSYTLNQHYKRISGFICRKIQNWIPSFSRIEMSINLEPHWCGRKSCANNCSMMNIKEIYRLPFRIWFESISVNFLYSNKWPKSQLTKGISIFNLTTRTQFVLQRGEMHWLSV